VVTVDAYLRSFVKQCVAFLYNEEVNRKGDLVKRPIGTCFFAGHATPDRKSIYLVTAKHVYKDLLAGDGGIYARVNVAAGGVHYFRLPRDGWTEHPNKEVDLAVLPWFPHIEKSQLLEGSEVDPDPQFITQGLPTTMLQGRPLPKSVEGTIFTLPLAVILLAPKYAAEWEKAWPPEEGEQVFFVGLMLHHQGTERNYPAFRMGHIALTPTKRST
jgi:hypothetical protein